MTGPTGPIGVFDSGVGGLTVVSALLRRYPTADLLYVADQAHVPYGGRPLTEVRSFATGITRALVAWGCRAVVMACNISSATALADCRSEFPDLPVTGVLGPAVEAALRAAGGQAAPRIGVLATEGTVATGAYPAMLNSACRGALVTQVACPDLVPLIENGLKDPELVRRRCSEYLRPLSSAGCSAIVLGCTHYPLALDCLRAAASGLFQAVPAFVDPSDAIVDELEGLIPLGAGSATVRLLTTGDPGRFEAQAGVWLGGRRFVVGSAQWQGSDLRR